MKNLLLILLLALLLVSCAANRTNKDLSEYSNVLSANYYTFAEAALEQKDYKTAIKLYQKAEEAAPENLYIKETLMRTLAFGARMDDKLNEKIISLGNKFYKQEIYSSEILLILAEAYIKLENYEKAEFFFKQSIKEEANMDNLASYYSFLSNENSIQDSSLIKQAIELPWKSELKVLRLAHFLGEFNSPKKLEVLKKVYEKWNNISGLKALLRYLEEHEEYEEIIKTISQRIDNGEELSPPMKTYYIGRLFYLKQYSKIISLRDMCLDIGNEQILKYLFVAAVKEERYELAIFVGNSLESLGDIPEKFKPTFYSSFAKLYIKTGQVQKAVDSLLKIKSLSSLEDMILIDMKLNEVKPAMELVISKYQKEVDNKNFAYYLASLYYTEISNDEKALNYLDRLPNDFILENHLSMIIASSYIANAKNIQKAQELIEEFINNNETIDDSIEEIITDLIFHSGADSLGYRYLKKNLQTMLNPSSTMFIYYSSIAESHETISEIIPILEKGVQLYPKDPDLLNAYAYLLVENEVHSKYNLAEQMLLKATEIKPESGMIWDSLAWLFFRQNKLDKALGAMEIPLKEKMKHSEIAYHLGEIYLGLNKLEKAEHYYKLSIELNNHEKTVERSKKQLKKYFKK